MCIILNFPLSMYEERQGPINLPQPYISDCLIMIESCRESQRLLIGLRT